MQLRTQWIFVCVACMVMSIPDSAAEAEATARAGAQTAVATAGRATGAAQRPSGWAGQWGLGVIANPRYVGGSEYNMRPVPYIDVRYRDEAGTRFFANVPQGVGGYLYRYRSPDDGTFLSVGVAIAPGFNTRDDSIIGLNEVGIATTARLLIEAGNRQWSAGATLAQDVGSGHEGALLDVNVARRGRIGEGVGFFAVGPVLRIGDSTYKDALFGIDSNESSVTGFPEYTASAGIERLGLQGLVSIPLASGTWRVTGILRASRLLGNAADSPLVIEETQLFGLVAITRSF